MDNNLVCPICSKPTFLVYGNIPEKTVYVKIVAKSYLTKKLNNARTVKNGIMPVTLASVKKQKRIL